MENPPIGGQLVAAVWTRSWGVDHWGKADGSDVLTTGELTVVKHVNAEVTNKIYRNL
jgi:hypothetical protein